MFRGNGEGLDFLDFITIYGLVLQIMNFQSDLRQANNDDLLSYLRHQDQDYFVKVLENQKIIIELLTSIQAGLSVGKEAVHS